MRVDMRLYPDQPGDRFAPSAAAGLVGQTPTMTVPGVPGPVAAEVVAAELQPDGAILVTAELLDWCDPDGCPASICGGPHVAHDCPGMGTVTAPVGDSCALCGRQP